MPPSFGGSSRGREHAQAGALRSAAVRSSSSAVLEHAAGEHTRSRPAGRGQALAVPRRWPRATPSWKRAPTVPTGAPRSRSAQHLGHAGPGVEHQRLRALERRSRTRRAPRGSGGRLQLHRRLALVGHRRPQAAEGGHGVEQPADAGGERRGRALHGHLGHRAPALVVHGHRARTRRIAVPHQGEPRAGHPPRLLGGAVAAGQAHRAAASPRARSPPGRPPGAPLPRRWRRCRSRCRRRSRPRRARAPRARPGMRPGGRGGAAPRRVDAPRAGARSRWRGSRGGDRAPPARAPPRTGARSAPRPRRTRCRVSQLRRSPMWCPTHAERALGHAEGALQLGPAGQQRRCLHGQRRGSRARTRGSAAASSARAAVERTTESSVRIWIGRSCTRKASAMPSRRSARPRPRTRSARRTRSRSSSRACRRRPRAAGGAAASRAASRPGPPTSGATDVRHRRSLAAPGDHDRPLPPGQQRARPRPRAPPARAPPPATPPSGRTAGPRGACAPAAPPRRARRPRGRPGGTRPRPSRPALRPRPGRPRPRPARRPRSRPAQAHRRPAVGTRVRLGVEAAVGGVVVLGLGSGRTSGSRPSW